MKYRPARWIPPATPNNIPVVCSECGIEHFTVFYIFQTLGIARCEVCLRKKNKPILVLES